MGAGIAIFAALLVLSLQASHGVPGLVVLPLAVVVCVIAGAVVLLAAAGSVPATLAFLVILVFVNDALFRTREAGQTGLDWQNGMKLALWAGAAAIGAFRLRASGELVLRVPVLACFAYAAVALVSASYSAAPMYSAATAFAVLALLLFAVAVSITLTEKQILAAFAVSVFVFLVGSWATYFAVPELGRTVFMGLDGVLMERFCGLAGQPNMLGAVVAVFLGVLFLLWYRGHVSALPLLPFFAFGLVTQAAADSRSSLLGFVVGVVAVMTRTSLWIWGMSFLGVFLGFAVLQGIPLRDLLTFIAGFSRSGDPTEVFTMTGRIDIWEFAWNTYRMSPWVGYGYNSSKFILPEFMGLGLRVDSAHNTLLENLLAVGLIGTVVMLVLLACALVAYVRAPNPFRDFFLFMLLVNGITESFFLGGTPSLVTLAFFIGVAMGCRPPAPLRLGQRPGETGLARLAA